MKRHFTEESWLLFEEMANDKYDFTTCQRPDGSYYGTGGQCRKGTETDKPEKKAKKPVDSGNQAGGEKTAEARKLAEKIKKDPVGAATDMANQDERSGAERVSKSEMEEAMNKDLYDPKGTFKDQFKAAKTNEERQGIANRAAAEATENYMLNKKMIDAQNSKSFQKQWKKAWENGDDDTIEMLAEGILQKGGIKNPTSEEIQRLAESWNGDDNGFRVF